MDEAAHGDLIFDIGMHKGEDVELYLARGDRVVAVEANPALVAAAEQRFREFISTGQLVIVGAAIADHDGIARLGIADSQTIWSTLDPEFVERNERAGTTYRYVEVPAMRFERLVEQHGMPHYLKVDIEGLDMLCVRALRSFDSAPHFISIESNVSVNRAVPDLVFDELAELWTLGYRRFRYVNQLHGQSTPFDGTDWLSVWAALSRAQVLRAHHNFAGFGGRWGATIPARIYKYLRKSVGRPPVGWYDLQAAR